MFDGARAAEAVRWSVFVRSANSTSQQHEVHVNAAFPTMKNKQGFSGRNPC